MSKTESESDETRDAILQAARDVAGRFGIDRTRMEDIAKKAGVSRQSLYNYFDGKEDLIAALVKQTAERINAHFEEGLPIVGASAPLLLERLVGGIEIALSDELTLHMSSARNSFVIREPMSRWWSTAFDHSRSRGEFRNGLSNEAALRWIRFFQYGVLEHPSRFRGPDDIRQLAQSFAIPPLLEAKPATLVPSKRTRRK